MFNFLGYLFILTNARSQKLFGKRFFLEAYCLGFHWLEGWNNVNFFFFCKDKKPETVNKVFVIAPIILLLSLVFFIYLFFLAFAGFSSHFCCVWFIFLEMQLKTWALLVKVFFICSFIVMLGQTWQCNSVHVAFVSLSNQKIVRFVALCRLTENQH